MKKKFSIKVADEKNVVFEDVFSEKEPLDLKKFCQKVSPEETHIFSIYSSIGSEVNILCMGNLKTNGLNKVTVKLVFEQGRPTQECTLENDGIGVAFNDYLMKIASKSTRSEQ